MAGIAAVGVLTNGVAYAVAMARIEHGEISIGPAWPRGHAVRVEGFRRKGTTGLSVEVMEWAADPDADGDLDDRLDVNLSLGSSCMYPSLKTLRAAWPRLCV